MSDGDGADRAIYVLYLIGALVLVASAFTVRRLKLSTAAKMIASWVLIFAAAFVIFTFKDEFRALGDRLLVAVRGGEAEETAPGETRVRMAPDGHYWVEADVNGEKVRFLIDSGATMTSISQDTANRAGIQAGDGFPVMVQTANGVVQAERGEADSLRVGNIQRRNLTVYVSGVFGDMNVLGMNFLSSLRSWGVEGRVLILRS